MKKIIVGLKNKSYPIVIACGISEDSLSYWSLKRGETAVFITDERVSSIYLHNLRNTLNSFGVNTDQLILPSGEENKSLRILNLVFTELLTKNYDRNVVLIALGGGVIGDLTGFAAATYQRGVRFIQVPTTLLSQVDASIGGKTGVNHALGKNMIGAFYQPISVIINLDFLCTLVPREVYSGLAEVIKYAIAFDSVFFKWLENNLDDLLILDPHALMYCVYRCCTLKASIVIKDEFEQGIRSLLNLGHTYGHAIESYLGYNKWSHGEAVSVGMLMAMSTSWRLGKLIDYKDIDRVKSLLERAGLPISGPKNMNPEDYLQYMIRDKKSRLGKISLVIPVTIGKSEIVKDINRHVILNSIRDNLVES